MLAYDDWRGFGLDPCPNAMRRAFFDAYKSDEDRDKNVDGDEKATEKAFQLDEEAMRKRNEEALARAAARRQVDSGDASAPGAEAAGPQTRRVRRALNKMFIPSFTRPNRSDL